MINLLFYRHDFHPGNREDLIDEEEIDEVEEILEFLGEQTEVNNLLREEFFLNQQRIMMMNNESTDDDEFYPDGQESDSSMSEHNSQHSPSTTSPEPPTDNNEEQPTTSRRIIDDYDPNDESDEVVRKIIAEIKKPRSKPPNIDTEDYPTDLSFHPNQNILAISTVTGDVIIYRYENEENKLLYTHEIHSKAVRDIEFSADGRALFSASRDKSIILSDFETGQFKRFWDNAHEEPIYTLTVIDENLIATGDDEGTIKLWDLRSRGSDPVFSIKEVDDYISRIITNNQKKLLVCTSGDGLMTTLNIASKKMYVQSEPYEEELTCAGIFRNESKVVVGSSKGNFYTYNWGEFGYHNDSFIGPSTPVSLMIPITERIAITAGDEGVIRAMHLFPGRILGVVGQHSLAVESMDISYDGEFIATSSHDNDVRFWSIKYFEDFDSISYNAKPNRTAASNNLPSSLRRNRADFFADLA